MWCMVQHLGIAWFPLCERGWCQLVVGRVLSLLLMVFSPAEGQGCSVSHVNTAPPCHAQCENNCTHSRRIKPVPARLTARWPFLTAVSTVKPLDCQLNN